MASKQATMQIYQEKDCKYASRCKFLVENATTRNIVDLLLVIIILVLLGIAAPIIRGDHCGELKFPLSVQNVFNLLVLIIFL